MLIPLLRPAHNHHQLTSLALHQRFHLLFESSCLGQWMTLTMLHWAEWKSEERLEWSSMVHRFMCKHTAGRKPPPCHLVISLSHYLATPPSPTSHCGVETVSLLLRQCTLHKQNCIQEDNKELHKGGRDSRVWLLTLSRGLSWTRSDMIISGPILLATHRLIWVTNETVMMHSCLHWTTRTSSYSRLAYAVVLLAGS